MSTALLLERHARGVGHTAAFLGCPACVAAGVYLCPGCLTPGPGRDGRGRHTRCIGPGRWAAFAGFLVVMAGVLVLVLGVVVAHPRLAMALFVAAVLLSLVWPHRVVILAWLLRPIR